LRTKSTCAQQLDGHFDVNSPLTIPDMYSQYSQCLIAHCAMHEQSPISKPCARVDLMLRCMKTLCFLPVA
jgi:hypothetical protein